MVDFNEMLIQLKAWKRRREKIGCACMAEVATVCFEFAQAIYDDRRGIKCKCECHER